MTYEWFDVTRNAGIARIMHMSYRSKTYTWNDVILVKRSTIRVFIVSHSSCLVAWYACGQLKFNYLLHSLRSIAYNGIIMNDEWVGIWKQHCHYGLKITVVLFARRDKAKLRTS